MTSDEKVMTDRMMDACSLAQEKNQTLYIVYYGKETNIHCCSSADPEVIAAITQPEVYNIEVENE